MVDGVRIRKVGQARDGERRAGRRGFVRGVGERGRVEREVEVRDEGVGAGGGDLLVVVPAEERAAVDRVVRVEDVVDAEQLVGRVAIGSGEDIEPS